MNEGARLPGELVSPRSEPEQGVAASRLSYEFSWRPADSEFGATHCVELPLLLGTADAWRGSPMLGTTPWDEVNEIGRALRADWLSFARTGSIQTEERPAGRGGPLQDLLS